MRNKLRKLFTLAVCLSESSLFIYSYAQVTRRAYHWSKPNRWPHRMHHYIIYLALFLSLSLSIYLYPLIVPYLAFEYLSAACKTSGKCICDERRKVNVFFLLVPASHLFTIWILSGWRSSCAFCQSKISNRKTPQTRRAKCQLRGSQDVTLLFAELIVYCFFVNLFSFCSLF